MSKSTSTSKAHGLKASLVKLNPDWQNPSAGRHHIFLFDGTWNDSTGANPALFAWDNTRQKWVSRADPAVAYSPVVTNVVKTHVALAPDSATQLTHYFRGVGNDDTHDTLNRFTEGAFARYEPFTRHFAYCELLRNYRRGDQISILGFSRGAASARLFARDLQQHGILSELMIESRYATVRTTGEIREEIWTTWPKSKHRVVEGKDLPIAFLGVWDTVAFAMTRDKKDWLVPANVRRAVHCLALDETRQPYEPTLLTYEPARAAAMKEVWFAGVHSDIGGGYSSDGLGRLTLDFVWRNWTNAIAADGLPALNWRAELAQELTATSSTAFLRHNEVADDGKILVRPRSCAAPDGAPPRVHVSVEEFVQQGGLHFCREDNAVFPPAVTVINRPYQPLAYPGAAAVELYGSTSWA